MTTGISSEQGLGPIRLPVCSQCLFASGQMRFPFVLKSADTRHRKPKFLRKKVDELLSHGLVRRNNSSEWACAPLIVLKDGPEKFRFTVDLQPVNSETILHTWPTPDLESMTSELAGDCCFSIINLCHGCW